jgi:hypothetical protein
MNQNEFDSLIDSLVDSVKDYNLNDSFDHYDAIHQICDGCDHSFVNYKAWQLVDFVKFDYSELFDEAEMEVKELCYHDQKSTLNDIILDYAFQILKVATLKKYNEQESEVMV